MNCQFQFGYKFEVSENKLISVTIPTGLMLTW